MTLRIIRSIIFMAVYLTTMQALSDGLTTIPRGHYVLSSVVCENGRVISSNVQNTLPRSEFNVATNFRGQPTFSSQLYSLRMNADGSWRQQLVERSRGLLIYDPGKVHLDYTFHEVNGERDPRSALSRYDLTWTLSSIDANGFVVGHLTTFEQDREAGSNCTRNPHATEGYIYHYFDKVQ